MNAYDEFVKETLDNQNKKHKMDSTLYEFNQLDEIDSRIESMMSNPAMRSTFGPKTKNVVVAFDTETTNALVDGDKRPFIYSYAITIMDIVSGENINIHCSTMNQFKKLIEYLCKKASCRVSNKIKTDKHGNKIDRWVENGTDDHHNYDDSNDVYLNIYVHNLPFDFSFLMNTFKLRTLFCSDTHRPYYALTWDGAKFIDTVVLTQKTLEQLGSGITMFDIKKQVGDLDYNKLRTGKTTFTDKEKGYIVSDTMVLAAYMVELCRSDYDSYLCKIPLTQTGKVREYLRKLCHGDISLVRDLYNSGFHFSNFYGKKLNDKELSKANAILNNVNASPEDRKNAKEVFSKFKKKISALYAAEIRKPLTIDSYLDYYQMKETYSGGFTHANVSYVDKVVKDVASFDFTSSYPAVMCSEEFPVGKYIRKNYSDEQFIKKLHDAKQKHKCYFFKFSFDRILQKFDVAQDSFLSESKVCGRFRDENGHLVVKHLSSFTDEENANNGVIINNGRVVNAENAYTYLTSVDWETISQVYDITNPHFSNIMEFETGYLPPQLIMAILHFYEKKTTLKHVVGKEHEYMLYKEQLNSLYGMTVQDPIHDIITYHDKAFSWSSDSDTEIDSALESYNKSQSRFLYYPWGIMITAYARRNLWTGIISCGKDYIYSDTDSIKIKHKSKHLSYIKKYNENVIAKIYKVCEYYNIPFDKTNPEDINGERHQLGIWDADDGHYTHFKTLGAKRYIDISSDNNAFECTVAGLPKKSGGKWMINKSKIKHSDMIIKDNESNINKLFSLFNDGMTIPEKYSGKLTHTYIDSYKGFDITDYQGHKVHIASGMGCFLSPASFTLSLSEKFINFICLYTRNKIEIDEKGFML